MEPVIVRTNTASYRALIGDGLIGNVGGTIAEMLARSRCAIVSDETVAPLWADKIAESLARAGFESVLL
ncbi:MAG: 3-dehydroquinate synthase, partial [Chthoniobacterales bacterium]